jgi:DNA adenine methylase
MTSTLKVGKLTPPLKWHGGKHYLATALVARMPPHRHYVEPFAGGLAVLLAKDPEGISEVANDLHGELTNFWKVLRDPAPFAAFVRIVEATPFSEVVWQEAQQVLQEEQVTDPVQRAVSFFIVCRQSLAGRMDRFAPLSRRRTRRGMNEQASAWLSALAGLAAVHARLQRIVVLNRPAVDVIRQQDGPDTLFYCDPPYLHATRADRDSYTHEMSADEHRQLLEVLRSVQGKVMLSGYPSVLYDGALAGWSRYTFDLPNNAAGGAAKGRETEVLWCNF